MAASRAHSVEMFEDGTVQMTQEQITTPGVFGKRLPGHLYVVNEVVMRCLYSTQPVRGEKIETVYEVNGSSYYEWHRGSCQAFSTV